MKAVSELSRAERAHQPPLLDNLPAGPGIRVAMQLTPAMGEHLRGLANVLLVDDFPGSSLTRYERELLATTVSASNGCFFCADSHAAHATALNTLAGEKLNGTIESQTCSIDTSDGKLQKLARVALNVTTLVQDYDQEKADIDAALNAGASSEDVQLTIAIAAGFSMYNRLVEGLRAPTPTEISVYDIRARQIAEEGYA